MAAYSAESKKTKIQIIIGNKILTVGIKLNNPIKESSIFLFKEAKIYSHTIIIYINTETIISFGDFEKHKILIYTKLVIADEMPIHKKHT